MSDAPRSGQDDAAWASLCDAVMAEALRFRSMIPTLMPVHRDRWVVFREGQVHSVHATEEEAFVAGLDRFGPLGGHIVAVVRPVEPIALSGTAALGL